MDKSSEKTLSLATVLAVVWLIADVFLGRQTHLATLTALLPYLTVATVMTAFVWFRARLARRAAEEKREVDLARRERADSSLFSSEDEKFDPFTLGRSHEQFERWVVPAFTALLALGAGYWGWRLFDQFRLPGETPVRPLVAASVLGGQTFLIFLLSRYILGLARHTASRLLRGPGVVLGLACLASLVGAAAGVAAEAGYPAVDRAAAQVLAALLGVLAVEMALNFIWELYRPRRGGELNRAYESRLGGLLTDPGTWVKNVGGALDYQFGFKVSDTWLYRFLEGALLPLIIFQLLALYLLSCLVFLGPDEEGILEQFGKPVPNAWHLDSGFHLKWPWPFETVRRFPVKRVQTLDLGFRDDRATNKGVILWTVPHYQQEDQFLAANPEAAAAEETGAAVPVNLVSFNVPIQYEITNVYDYAYQCTDPKRILEQIGYRSLTLEAATHGLFYAIGEGRLKMAQSLQQSIQNEADRLHLGIRIVFVGLQGVHPPVSVADAFESVIGATEESEASVLNARADAIKVIPIAMADAEKTRLTADAYAVRRAEIASAEADRYLKRREAYQKSPAVFCSRAYLEAVRDSLQGARKYIVAAPPGKQIVILDMAEKLSPDLFDFSPKTPPAAPGSMPPPRPPGP